MHDLELQKPCLEGPGPRAPDPGGHKIKKAGKRFKNLNYFKKCEE